MKKDSAVDCHARTITEEELHAAVVRAVSKVYAGTDYFLLQLERNIEKGMAGKSTRQVDEIDARIGGLQGQSCERLMRERIVMISETTYAA